MEIIEKGKSNSEKMWKKGKLNCEKIRKIWKKPKLNSEKIWTIWKKDKLIVKRYEKNRRKVG
jgi:hypothetical protein